MSLLKKLKWLKYLFVDETEAQAEQDYWNTKRKKHMSKEHSAGIAEGLDVTEDSPPSLEVAVAVGRCVDSNGDDPEIETPEVVDCSGLVPGAGSQTVYIVLEYESTETDPYYVPEIGGSQNKYVQDGYTIEATLTPAAAPALELARIELATGATEITDPAVPGVPVDNEIDSTHRVYTSKEILALVDLSDVSQPQSDAFAGMASPGAGNPIGMVDDITSKIATHSGLGTGVHGVGGSTVDSVTARNSAIGSDIATHAALGTGVHGAGGNVLATDADIATHSGLGTGVHGVGGSLVDSVTARNSAIGNHASDADAHHSKLHQATHVGGADAIPVATTAVDGLMAAVDKTKLDILRDLRASRNIRFYDEFVGYSLADGEIGRLHWNKEVIGGGNCTLSWGHADANWQDGMCGNLKMATPAAIGQGTHLKVGSVSPFHMVRGWRYVVGFMLGNHPFYEGKVLLGFYKSNTGDATPPDGIWIELDADATAGLIKGVVANAGTEHRTAGMHSFAAVNEFVRAEFEVYDDGGTRKVRFRVNEGTWYVLSAPDLPLEGVTNALCCGVYTKEAVSKELYVDYVDAWCEFDPRYA